MKKDSGQTTKDVTPLTIKSLIIEVAWPYRWYLIAQIFIQILCAAYTSFSSYTIKHLIDIVGKANYSVGASQVYLYAGVYLCALVMVIAVQRFYNWLVLKTSPCIEQETLCFVADHLINHHYSFYQEQFAGSLTNNARLVAGSTVRLIEICIERLFRPFITLVLALWTVSMVGLTFSLLLFIWFILFACGSWYAAPHLKSLSEHTARNHSNVVGQVVDILTNILSIRLFSNDKAETQRIESYSQTAMHAEQKKQWFFLKLQLFQGILLIVFVTISLWFLIKGYKHGSISPGDFSLILMLNDSMNHILWRLAQDLSALYENIGILQHGLKTLIAPKDKEAETSQRPLVVTQGEITFENVYFNYHKTSLFVDVSLKIASHQKVGLVGYSGSGKSSLVNLILRLFDIQQGIICIDGQDIRQVSQESLRKAIAFIPQNPTLFHRSVYDNIAYGLPHATPLEVHAAAQKAHADEFIRLLADGYDMNVGQGGNRLSGGQRQRIAIARAFLKNAPLLILDEATSQLDASTEYYIQESLKTLMHGKTTLVIAHRLSTVRTMERILVFDKGVIVQDGSHEQLLAQKGVYKDLWEHQTGDFLGDQTES